MHDGSQDTYRAMENPLQHEAEKLNELTLAIAQLEDKIQKKYDRWTELEMKQGLAF